MSFFGKHKDKERGDQGGGGGQKSQFYVEFLGWMECGGVRGRKYADPVVQELRRRQKKTDSPPKLTIQVTPKELRITQDFESSSSDLKRGKGKHSSAAAGGGGGGGIKKIKFPAIPARDVTYVVQASRPQDGRPDDIVACIYLGFMPRTQRWVHVHVYRFDEAATAATFARLMGGLVEANANRILQVERELAERGDIEDPRLASSDGLSQRTGGTGSGSGGGGSVYSEDGSPTFGSEDMEDDLRSMADVREFDSVANELKQKLKMGDGPLLLPPKDYDTISRARGNLMDINSRRCLNLTIVGEGRLTDETAPDPAPRDRNGSGESGVDLTSPTSEGEAPFPRLASSSSSSTTTASQQPKQTQPVKSPGSAGSGSPQVGAPQENGFVYPPRVPRSVAPAPALVLAPAPAGSLSPEQPRHARQSSHDSAKFGTSTSRTSLNSNHSGGGGDSAIYAQVYRRSDSSSSGGAANRPGGVGGPGHGRSGSFDREAVSPPEEEDLFPPTDYDDSPLVAGPAGRPRVFRPPTAPKPAASSGSGLPGSGPNTLLMRSLPANVLHGEMSGMAGGPGPGRPREARGAASEELPYNPLRTSLRGSNSYGNPDLVQEYRPHSAGYVQGGGPIRRINSYR